MKLTTLDKVIICELQNSISLDSRPFNSIAEQIGITEVDLIKRIELLQEKGFIRRVGAVVNHRKMGYIANPMIAWNVPDNLVDKAGQEIAAYSEVTHCYLRPRLPDFPYNIYSMIHNQTREASAKMAKEISVSIGIADYMLLYSSVELKKSSMKYFNEEGLQEA
ncbi:MAG: transcriptional regulator [Desulfitibacter sp. BRH_c19]|nr:MAG: transcriptional regulator [Desulfitibacter sp. BRH_c19]